jgi:uncharacterized membrane protein YkoI
LASQAKITDAQANAADLGQFPGGSVKKTEVESENGAVIYSVHLTDSAGKRQKAKLDATTGRLLPAEGRETPGAPETGETSD